MPEPPPVAGAFVPRPLRLCPLHDTLVAPCLEPPPPANPQAQYYEDRACFTWDGVAAADQLSTYPPADQKAAHFATFFDFQSSGGKGTISREDYLARREKHSSIRLHNIGECQNKCSGEGNCFAYEQGQPFCACFFGRTGGQCEAKLHLACYTECSGAPESGPFVPPSAPLAQPLPARRRPPCS